MAQKGVYCCLMSVAAVKPKHPVIVLESNKVTVGRSLDVDVCLRSNVISRLHAVLCKSTTGDNTWTISDNKSLNGVFVNSHQIEPNKHVALHDGDIIQFGVSVHKHTEPEFIYKFCQERTVKVLKRKRDRDVGESSHKKVFVSPNVPDRSGEKVKRIVIDDGDVVLPSSSSTGPAPQCSRTLSSDVELPKSSTGPARSSMPLIVDVDLPMSSTGPAHCSRTLIVDVDLPKLSTGPSPQCLSTLSSDVELPKSSSTGPAYSPRLLIVDVDLRKSSTRPAHCSKTLINDVCDKLTCELSHLKPKRRAHYSTTSICEAPCSNVKLSTEKAKSTKKSKAYKKKGHKVTELKRLLKAKEDEMKAINAVLEKERNKSELKELELKDIKEQQETLLKEIQDKKIKSDTKNAKDKSTSDQNCAMEAMETEFTCIICSELFIKATTLNCTHSFCLHCINEWRTKKNECPICRTMITSQTHALVLDNFIDQMVQSKPELLTSRTNLIAERNASDAQHGGAWRPVAPAARWQLEGMQDNVDVSDADEDDDVDVQAVYDYDLTDSEIDEYDDDDDNDDGEGVWSCCRVCGGFGHRSRDCNW